MKNKLLLALLSALGVGALESSAQTVPAAQPNGLGITATATGVSQYMFRGQRLGGFSLQPALEWAAGDAALGIWTNFPVKDKVPDTSDPEIDLYGSYAFDVGGMLKLNPGFTYYWFPDAPIGAGFYRSTFEPNLAASFTFEGVEFTPKLYYDIILRGPTYELSAAYALPLTGLGVELNFTGTIGTYYLRDVVNGSSPRTKAWGDYWLLGVSVPFQIRADATVILGYAYTEGRNAFTKQGTLRREPNSLAVGRGVVTLSYSHSF